MAPAWRGRLRARARPSGAVRRLTDAPVVPRAGEESFRLYPRIACPRGQSTLMRNVKNGSMIRDIRPQLNIGESVLLLDNGEFDEGEMERTRHPGDLELGPRTEGHLDFPGVAGPGRRAGRSARPAVRTARIVPRSPPDRARTRPAGQGSPSTAGIRQAHASPPVPRIPLTTAPERNRAAARLGAFLRGAIARRTRTDARGP